MSAKYRLLIGKVSGCCRVMRPCYALCSGQCVATEAWHWRSAAAGAYAEEHHASHLVQQQGACSAMRSYPLSLREHKRQDKGYGLWHRAFQLPLPWERGQHKCFWDRF